MAQRRVSLHEPSGYQTGLESKALTEIEVAVLGAPRVGKTAIVSQFLHGVFPEKYVPTVDDMSWVEYETSGGGQLMLKVIDSSGSHEFAAMRSLYIRSADAFILVCSVQDSQSVNELMSILDEIQTRNEKAPQIVVVANQIDLSQSLEDSLETLDSVARLASSKGVKHHAISAKDPTMVSVEAIVFSSAHLGQTLGFSSFGGSDEGCLFTINRVIEGSPAERAGLCVGDEIIEINGTTIIHYSHADVVKFIHKCIQQKHLELKVKRLLDRSTENRLRPEKTCGYHSPSSSARSSQNHGRSATPSDAFLVSVDEKNRLPLETKLHAAYPGIRTHDMNRISQKSPPMISPVHNPLEHNSSYDSGHGTANTAGGLDTPTPWYKTGQPLSQTNGIAETSFIEAIVDANFNRRSLKRASGSDNGPARSDTPEAVAKRPGAPVVKKSPTPPPPAPSSGRRLSQLPISYIDADESSHNLKDLVNGDARSNPSDVEEPNDLMAVSSTARLVVKEPDPGYESDLWKKQDSLISDRSINTQVSPNLATRTPSGLTATVESSGGQINPAFSPSSPLTGKLLEEEEHGPTVIRLSSASTLSEVPPPVPSSPIPPEPTASVPSTSRGVAFRPSPALSARPASAAASPMQTAKAIWHRYSLHKRLGMPEANLTSLLSSDVAQMACKSSSQASCELADILSRPVFHALMTSHDMIAQSLQESCPHLSGEVLGTKTTVLDDHPQAAQIRLIRLVKEGASPLGATVRADEGDIYIGRVVKGGVAERSGLVREGDRVLEVNGVDVTGKSIEAVCDILTSITGEVSLRVIPAAASDDSPSASRLSVVRHMRALFSYDPDQDPYMPCRELALNFTRGDVLHVISTKDASWWQAYRDGSDNSLAGLIPSAQFQTKRETFQRNLGKGHVKRSDSLFAPKGSSKRKQPRHTSSLDLDLVDPGQPAVHTYEEVSLYMPGTECKRPLVLVGPLGCLELRTRLLEEHKGRFCSVVPHTSRPRGDSEMNGIHYWFVGRLEFQKMAEDNRFLEWGEYQKHLYGTSVEAVRSAMPGHTCVVTLKAQSIPSVRNAALMPYIVYIAPPKSVEQLKAVLHKIKLATGKSLDMKQVIIEARSAEQQFGHYFDAVIPYIDKAYSKLLELVTALETEPQWVPLSWVDRRPPSPVSQMQRL